ncbi:MAG: hypothetical protein COA78_18770 [Blastopirellula sp.]|nr:MAG: hypothetical protein COA78_18770 [Blastopirellula sp.]
MTASIDSPASNTPDSENKPVTDPDQYRRGAIFFQRLFLVLAVLVLTAAFLLQTDGTETVGLPLLNFDLPPTCGMKLYWGIDCPGCGLTRSFIYLASGDISASVAFNPAGIILFAATIFQVPYRILQLRRLRKDLEPWNLLVPATWMFAIVAVVMSIQWVVKLL